MNVRKPKIWKRAGFWYCGYYSSSGVDLYTGLTPRRAYDSWKFRNDLRGKIMTHQDHWPAPLSTKKS